MARKAQGLSLNVIIIAAIALLVLVILAIIFIGRMGTTTKGIDACKGQCIDESLECNEELGEYYKELPGDCPQEGQICCVGV
jgi:hypothetical protein